MIKAFIIAAALGLVHSAERSLTEPHDACPASGHALLPHEYDCTKFYYCEGGQKFIAARDCPSGTEFSATQEVCIHPTLADCQLPGYPTQEASTTDPLSEESDEDVDSCEYLENGCPADFSIHLLLPHETSCRKFYYCVNGEKVQSQCNRGSVFNPDIQNCGPPGSINRICEDEDSSSEESVEQDDHSSEEIELLPNGCPVNWGIYKYLPHATYCNKYYQCIFGELVERWCATGTHFNPAIERCDHPANVGCTLPGGDAIEEVETAPVTTTTTEAPGIEFLENGCPVDGTITWMVAHEQDCGSFYHCVWGMLIQGACPGGLHFSPKLQRCESPSVAGCKCGDNGCSSENDVDNPSSEEDLPAEVDPGCVGSDCNAVSSSEEDLPAGDAPGCSGNDCDNECTGNDCNAVSSSEEDLPAGDAPGCSGNDCDNECTGNDCNTVSSSEEDLPAGDAPGCSGNDCDNQCTGTDCDNVDSGCIGNDCDNQCTGDDCSNDVPDCTGNDCDNECTGDDCNNDDPDCTGNDCDNECTGDDCNNDVSDCTGNDCDNQCTGTDCDNVDSGCIGNDCDNQCTGDDCNNDVPDCTGNDCDSECTGDDCNNDVPDCTGNDCDNECTGDDCNNDVPDCTGNDCDNECTGDDCSNDVPDCTGNDCENQCTGTDCDNVDSGCIGNDCDNQCTGDDCANDVPDCTGNDCDDASAEDSADPDCPVPIDPEQVCAEECNVLPWAHDDCDKYWRCDGKEPILVVCSEGLQFNPNTYTCDFSCNVGCERESIQTTASNDGLRIYLPWSKVDKETQDLLKLITH